MVSNIKKWINDDLLKQKSLNILIEDDDLELFNCWLFMENNTYYITDCECRLMAQLGEKLSVNISNETCVKIKVKSYLYTSLIDITVAKEVPYILIFIQEYFVRSKIAEKIDNAFDKNQLKNGHHRSLDQIDNAFQISRRSLRPRNRNSSISITKIKKSPTSNNETKKKENMQKQPEISNLSCFINEMSTLGSLENYTLEIVAEVNGNKKLNNEIKEVKKNLETKNLNNAFLTQSETLAVENHPPQISTNELTASSIISTNSTTNAADSKYLCSSQIDKNEFNSLLKNIDNFMENNEKPSQSNIASSSNEKSLVLPDSNKETTSSSIVENNSGQAKAASSQSTQCAKNPAIDTEIISTQIDTRSKELLQNELNSRFKPISPIQEKTVNSSNEYIPSAQQKLDEKTVNNSTDLSDPKSGNNEKSVAYTDDDDSIDAIWLDKNKIIEETKEIKTQTEKQNETENQSQQRVNRLFSVASSHSSYSTDVSSNISTIFDKQTNLDLKLLNGNKKRKKLVNLDEFYNIKDKNKKKRKTHDSKKQRKRKTVGTGFLARSPSSVSISSSVSTDASSPSSSISGLSFSSNSTASTQDDSLSDAETRDDKQKRQPSAIDMLNNNEDVFELCSQSLIFESRTQKLLKQKALSEKKAKETKRSLASNLFAPRSANGKGKLNPLSENYLTNDLLRTNSCNLHDSYLKSPILNENSKLIDKILISKEKEKQELEKTKKKSGRKRLFDVNLQDIDKAFDISINEENKASKSAKNPDNSTTKLINNSNEISIPLAQKPPSVNNSKTSFLTNSNTSSNNSEQERYFNDLRKKLANFDCPIKPNDLQDYLIEKHTEVNI